MDDDEEQAPRLSIGEVASRAGLAPSAIRYYEAFGLLPEPERVNRRRRYDESVLRWLDAIGLAQRAGFTLAEIRILLIEPSEDAPLSERWQALARQKLPEVEALRRRAQEMERLLSAGIECGCVRPEDCELLADLRPLGGSPERSPAS